MSYDAHGKGAALAHLAFAEMDPERRVAMCESALASAYRAGRQTGVDDALEAAAHGLETVAPTAAAYVRSLKSQPPPPTPRDAP